LQPAALRYSAWRAFLEMAARPQRKETKCGRRRACGQRRSAGAPAREGQLRSPDRYVAPADINVGLGLDRDRVAALSGRIRAEASMARRRTVAVAIILGLAWAHLAAAEKNYGPGVSDTEIKLGPDDAL
jgi:hypothetical protein